MVFNDLHFIKNYFGNNALRRLSGSRRDLVNRISSNAGNRFKNMLTAFQTHNSDNFSKSKGLTIADYRAHPVISKSRCRPQMKPATEELKKTVTNRFPKHLTPPAIKKDPSKNQSLSRQDGVFQIPPRRDFAPGSTRNDGGTSRVVVDSKNVKFAKKPDRTALQPKVDSTEQAIIDQNVQKAAAKYDLSPDLIRGVIRAESNFKVKAISSAGAQGLMQLMPATAKELGVKNPFNIEQNIDGGAKYLRKMLDRFGGNVKTALAAYNAGPGTVIKYNGQVPYPETRQYVRRVLRFSRQMV